MSSNRSISRVARCAVYLGIVSAGIAMAVPAHAEPLWPGGPDVPGVPAIVPPTPVAAPCGAAARACLKLGTNEAWLMDNGKVVFGPTPISHGKAGFETPPGNFAVFIKKPFHWSTMHHAPMHYAMFFNGDIAFHVGPIESESHGCIRMTWDGAREFYNYMNLGDTVEVVA
ncbi:L,D-transpeptidase [Nocardia uniformis]|uniref:L,D-transpeptidase n=1 Tax=Nocardia uniformis TaxID=53432 RepID=A0A849BWM9_9NOCA|nr:L,D-transpeptidase [Nocardia uniformis]NNH70654.1 L,D-transpeptidase [Nocardia uniformis]